MERKTEELVQQLKRIAGETGHLSAACLGCRYGYQCSIHGCQLISRAATQLEVQDGRVGDMAKERAALVALLKQSEEARTDLGRRLARTEKDLHETKSELDRVVRRLAEECDCDLCKHRNAIEGCDEPEGCLDCGVASCICKSCSREHSNFELAERSADVE